MKSLAALWYLDFHRARNAARAIVRSPGRLLLWAFVGLWFMLQMFARTHTQRSIFFFHDLADPYATAFAGLVLVLFGLTLGVPTERGRIMAFGDPVDALFLARSAIDERLVLSWLQLRQLLLNSWRIAIGAVFVALYFSRNNPIGAMAALAGIFALLELLMLPTILTGRRTNLLKYFWYLVALVGIGIFAGAFLLPGPVERLDLGRALIALWQGNGIALATLYACIVVVLVGSVAGAHDVYPEFYASARWLDTARARGRRGEFFGARTSAKSSRSGTTLLRGPWVEIWKQLAFLRRRNGTIAVSVGAVIAVVLGVVGGLGQLHSAEFGFVGVFTVLPIILIFQTMGSVSLAQDISKPLWWMGGGSTFARLAVWTFASALPAIAFVALAAGTMFAIASPVTIPAYVFALTSLVVVSRAVGVLGYALTPSLVDQRGPGTVVRLLLLYAAAIPPALAGILAGALSRSLPIGITCAALVFLAEGAACIALAAARLNGRGLEAALAEAT
jgi:Putative ABC exporter